MNTFQEHQIKDGHVLLPAVTDGDMCNLSFQSPPPGGVLRLNNSEDTLQQFVDASRHGDTHMCTEYSDPHPLRQRAVRLTRR